MAYDIDLVERIREVIAAESGLSERRMFGGLAFLLQTWVDRSVRFARTLPPKGH